MDYIADFYTGASVNYTDSSFRAASGPLMATFELSSLTDIISKVVDSSFLNRVK